MALKVTYEVDGVEGIREMIAERVESERNRYTDGTVTGERKAKAAVEALETVLDMLSRTRINGTEA